MQPEIAGREVVGMNEGVGTWKGDLPGVSVPVFDMGIKLFATLDGPALG